MATHSGILAWRIPKDRGAWWATVHEVAELDMTEHQHQHHQGLWTCTSMSTDVSVKIKCILNRVMQ